MTQAPLPPAEYYATLPKQISGAGVIIRDGDERVLLIQTTYRDDGYWEIPGGGLNEGEFPFDAARREVKEELGLDLIPGGLLAVDVVPPQPDGRPALTNFLFDGGILTDEQRATIRCADGELGAWKYCGPDEYATRLPPHMVRRVDACLQALRTGQSTYLQHGWLPDGKGVQ
ncbi:MAG: NUDIX domain-containing protein [Sciscionella sp.]